MIYWHQYIFKKNLTTFLMRWQVLGILSKKLIDQYCYAEFQIKFFNKIVNKIDFLKNYQPLKLKGRNDLLKLHLKIKFPIFCLVHVLPVKLYKCQATFWFNCRNINAIFIINYQTSLIFNFCKKLTNNDWFQKLWLDQN